jgi:hypothetical protein
MLEYAWDVSPKNYVKCDPCVATAPSTQDLLQAGVWWINRDWNDYSNVEDEDYDYSPDVYFTRLHVRYNRNSFPQDLAFQITPNKENYQARYIITHPANGDFNCAAGKKYLQDLKRRRVGEMESLKDLTGKGYTDWDVVMNNEEKQIPSSASYASASLSATGNPGHTNGFFIATLGMIGVATLFGLGRRKA